MYRFTISTDLKWIQDRCMAKISYDDGQTWWPPGPLEIHVAGYVYVLLLDGRYQRKR